MLREGRPRQMARSGHHVAIAIELADGKILARALGEMTAAEFLPNS